mmetsp:Transcript_9943/g.26471  ORF Transcript_9943/g.26471 Transcript_9943/m.26471 type:complete len:302 (-) Transcript_9943:18-923(-)
MVIRKDHRDVRAHHARGGRNFHPDVAAAETDDFSAAFRGGLERGVQRETFVVLAKTMHAFKLRAGKRVESDSARAGRHDQRISRGNRRSGLERDGLALRVELLHRLAEREFDALLVVPLGRLALAAAAHARVEARQPHRRVLEQERLGQRRPFVRRDRLARHNQHAVRAHSTLHKLLRGVPGRHAAAHHDVLVLLLERSAALRARRRSRRAAFRFRKQRCDHTRVSRCARRTRTERGRPQLPALHRAARDPVRRAKRPTKRNHRATILHSDQRVLLPFNRSTAIRFKQSCGLYMRISQRAA